MKKYAFILATLFIIPQLLSAQNFTDGFRLSFYRIQGTARSAGMGNAFGALGGDFSSLSINPAGSGVYRSNEFIFTPSYNINSTDISLNGKSFSDNKQTIKISNIGAVGIFNTSGTSTGLVSVNYGIGFNRLADFYRTGYANYDGSSTSYLDGIASYATDNSNFDSWDYISNQKQISDFSYAEWPTVFAWDNGLITPATDSEGNEIEGEYVANLYSDETVDQHKTYEQKGHLDEYIFNISFNFNHKFYIGANISIFDYYYRYQTAYNEVFSYDSKEFWYDDNLAIDGNGYNFSIGAIYKPISTVRLGLAFHSPTWFDLDDESLLGMESDYTNDYEYGINNYSYEFTSPMKVVFSGAVLFANKGLLSVDAEYMDYSDMRFRHGADGDDFNDLNSEMSTVYDDVFNLRLGGELRLSKEFSVRAGYEFYGNPFKDGMEDEITVLTDDVQSFSFGFGYNVNNFSFNAAYVNTAYDWSVNNDQPNYYQLSQEDTSNKILMSFGFKF